MSPTLWKGLRYLTLVPFAVALGSVFFFNRVTPLVFGLSVFMVWCVGCVLLTAAIMALLYACDPANKADAEDDR